jgi:hypothetical protein
LTPEDIEYRETDRILALDPGLIDYWRSVDVSAMVHEDELLGVHIPPHHHAGEEQAPEPYLPLANALLNGIIALPTWLTTGQLLLTTMTTRI